MTQTQPAGWYQDPTGVSTFRYWDGRLWTNQISGDGRTATDPNPMDLGIAGTPPAPGTAAPMPPTTPPQATVQVVQKSNSAFGTVLGVLIAVILIAILIIFLVNQGDDDGSTATTQTPVTTEAPES